jgi:hypothetical protein
MEVRQRYADIKTGDFASVCGNMNFLIITKQKPTSNGYNCSRLTILAETSSELTIYVQMRLHTRLVKLLVRTMAQTRMLGLRRVLIWEFGGANAQ